MKKFPVFNVKNCEHGTLRRSLFIVKTKSNISERINDILVCIIQKNTRSLVQLMIELELIIPTSEPDDIVAFLDALLQFFESYDSDKLNETVIQTELNESLVRERPFLLPPEFLFLGKSLILIDGICRQLEPKFNFIAYLTPIIQENVMQAIDIQQLASTAIEMPNRIKAINSSVISIEKAKGDLKRSAKSTQRDILASQMLNFDNFLRREVFCQSHVLRLLILT